MFVPLNYLLTVSRRTTNDVADPNAARNNTALFCLSQLFPSVHVSEIQKIVDVLERAEVEGSQL